MKFQDSDSRRNCVYQCLLRISFQFVQMYVKYGAVRYAFLSTGVASLTIEDEKRSFGRVEEERHTCRIDRVLRNLGHSRHHVLHIQDTVMALK